MKQKLGLALGGLLLAFLVLEVLFRFLPEPAFTSNIVYDPLLGHRGPKDTFLSSCDSNFGQVLGCHRLYYNHQGYRNFPFDPAREREGSKLRIAFLGDSITEGTGYQEHELFQSWVKDVLNASLPSRRQVEVYRFASSDWGTLQETLAYERDIKPLRPHVVVLQFLGLNDFFNNSLSFAGENPSVNDEWRPYIDPEDPGRVVASTWQERLRKWSALYRQVFVWRERAYGYLRRPLRKQTDYCSPLKQLFLEKPADPRWEHAFRSTRAIVKRLKASLDPETKLLAVYFPSRLELSDREFHGEIALPLERCSPGAGPVLRRAAEGKFREIFTEEGVEVFSLWDTLQQAGKPEAIYDPSGHLNAQGHEAAGRAIARILTRPLENAGK